MMDRKQPSKKLLRSSVLYTSRIIKATALLADTKTLLSNWETNATIKENCQRFKLDNVFGKTSRSRVQAILAIFHRRFMTETSVTRALVVLMKKRFPTVSLDQILYFHAARADRLIFDYVTEILGPRYACGLIDVDIHEVQRSLAQWFEEGKIASVWSEVTTQRVAQHLLATLRDFGVLQGATKKKILPSFLPTESFAYIAYYLKQHQPSGAKLLELPDWKLFFLSRETVERFLFEAHQQELLEYHVAGSVTRLTFPANTLEEYANVLAQR